MLKSLKKFFLDPQFGRKKAFLKSLVLFQDLRDRDLGVLSQALHSRTYHAGEVVFMEGDIGRALFILESGRIELTKRGSDGEPQLIATLGPGDYFGEMALLEQRPRLASAVAVEQTGVYMLYKAKLESLYVEAPRLALAITLHLAQVLSARLRTATERLVISAPQHPHATAVPRTPAA